MADHELKLPENAYRELKPGEVYVPVVPQEKGVLEITLRSIGIGILMGIIFSAAAAYIALKLGQGIESAIPISILAIGASALMARKSSLLENVNILAIGATSGILVGGSVFTMPAIYVLGLQDRSSFFQIFIVPFLGAVLGVLFLIPFRRYFVAEMHGKLPFPEGTAITEILMTGERGGQQAKVLVSAMGLGFFFDLIALTFGAWRDVFTTSLVRPLHVLTDKVKAIFALNTSAAVLGLGYIIGLRYAAIICAGSFLAYFVLIPLVAWFGAHIPGPITQGLPAISSMSASDIFDNYVRYIGIGGIFMAGILSIIKMSPVMVQAMGKAFTEIRKMFSGGLSHEPESRLDADIPMGWVLVMTAMVTVAIWLYFRFSVLAAMPGATRLATLALILTLVITFLFAAVSAWAVAMISVTPISGMTLTTLIVAAILLAKMGLSGPEGMLATLLIGGIVCTALSMTGSLVTQFKIGYWLGATPKRIQWANIWGSAIASITVTAMIMLFATVYGYTRTAAHPNPMPAPQANAMAAVIQSVMSSAHAPWLLYGVGAAIALIVEMLGISALAFALGMYLPIELNTPILFGAMVSELVRRRSPDETTRRARNNRGTLIASGLIAGGALAGVADGIARMIADWRGWSIPSFHNLGNFGNWLGLGMFCLLAVYVIWDASRARPEEGAGPEISM
ncbi:MAG TPA: oligopeptide transporter, OPT family [Acidobacteria bacterium]|nr:oligopeptide transporter, OPT family [Acidobacteriota bacterium]